MFWNLEDRSGVNTTLTDRDVAFDERERDKEREKKKEHRCGTYRVSPRSSGMFQISSQSVNKDGPCRGISETVVCPDRVYSPRSHKSAVSAASISFKQQRADGISIFEFSALETRRTRGIEKF